MTYIRHSGPLTLASVKSDLEIARGTLRRPLQASRLGRLGGEAGIASVQAMRRG